MKRGEKPNESLPLTTLLPDHASEPIVMYDSHAALMLALVERDYAQRIGEEWNQPGNYILLDLPDVSGSWGCYVGKAPAGVRSRLLSHLRGKDHWRRALLIQRDTTHGFNSAQVAWLEGRLYDMLDAAENAVLHNGNRPSDETLPAYERASLENSVLPIQRVLRLIGYDPATADDSGMVSTANTPNRTSRFHGITLQQIVQAGLVTAGAEVTSTNRVWPSLGVITADGSIEVDGKTYPTPSSAAGAVKGGAANGWEFWAVKGAIGQTTLATLRTRYKDGRNELL